METRILSVERVGALKAMADVCLHASKTEGFGLNVLEAQLIGTPVVTTAFGAMADFTRYGLSVPPVQHEWVMGGRVATPHVPGIADALASVWRHQTDGEWVSANLTDVSAARAREYARGAHRVGGPPEGRQCAGGMVRPPASKCCWG